MEVRLGVGTQLRCDWWWGHSGSVTGGVVIVDV